MGYEVRVRGAAYGNVWEAAGNYIALSSIFDRYCLIARGSLGELGSYIQDSERWGLISGDMLKQIVGLYADTSYLLDRLIQSLRKKQKEGTWDKDF